MQRPHPPIIVGGSGKRRTPALAARFADEFNANFTDPDKTTALFDGVRAACAEIDRDPGTLRLSTALPVCCGRDEAEVRTRAQAMGREPAELRKSGIAGTPAECVDRLGRFAEAGSQRMYLQLLDLADLDQIELVAAEVMPHLS